MVNLLINFRQSAVLQSLAICRRLAAGGSTPYRPGLVAGCRTLMAVLSYQKTRGWGQRPLSPARFGSA